MNKKYIFILGTGRCGTMSLSSLLNKKEGFNITHERYRMPWKPDLIALGINLQRLTLREGEISGDAGFWYLQYAKLIIQSGFLHEVHFVCLKRDKRETIDSYMRKTPNTNNWTRKGSKFFDKDQVPSEEWYRCYPSYNLPKRKALEKYYDKYYKKARTLLKQFDNFRIFQMDHILNTENGQKELYRFLGMSENIIELNIKLNMGRHKEEVKNEISAGHSG